MSGITPQDVFDEIEKGMASDPTLISTIGGVFHFVVNGKSWTVDLKNGSGSVKSGTPSTKADCTITINDADFVNMMTGKVNGQNLFMQGKLKIQGNMGLAMKLDKLPRKKADQPASAPKSQPASAPKSQPASTPSASTGSGLKSVAVFEELTKRIASNPGFVQQIGGIYQFDITGANGKSQSWNVDLKNGKGTVAEGKSDKAECTLTIGDDDFVGMMTGKLNSQQLFMQGKLKIKGNMGLAMKLGKLNAPKAAL